MNKAWLWSKERVFVSRMELIIKRDIKLFLLSMVANTFNPNTGEAEADGSPWVQASMVHRANSRPLCLKFFSLVWMLDCSSMQFENHLKSVWKLTGNILKSTENGFINILKYWLFLGVYEMF